MVRSSTIISPLSAVRCAVTIFILRPCFLSILSRKSWCSSSRPRAITNISILPSHKLLQIIVSRLQTPWTPLRYLLHNECICYATNRNVEKTRTVLGEDEDIYWSFKQRFAKTSPVERAFTFKPLLRHYDLWRRYAKSLVGTFNRSRGHLYRVSQKKCRLVEKRP